MNSIKIDFNINKGKIKPMHAVNNGPSSGNDIGRTNYTTYKSLKLPYARNHDASLSECYGSQHLVDIHCIFPDFERDVNDESAYDFTLTDEYTKNVIAADSENFYRLGTSIEHWPKKYGTIMPPDFEKWAKICEHIILHYNNGWANGYNFNIKYFEIWNEPDLDEDDASNKRTWSGTKAEFFDFYETAAKYLKSRFPHLKIGGPALATKLDWAEDFLCEMKKRAVPLDFFSWHIYTYEPKKIIEKAKKVDALIEKYGYTNAEHIINEWNYVKNWSNRLEFIKAIKGIKGASFCAAVMCALQAYPTVDLLMYYDARPEKIWNGMFNSDTLLPLKGYYPFAMFSELYELGEYVNVVTEDEALYTCAAKSSEAAAIMLTNYRDEGAEEKDVKIEIYSADFIGKIKAKYYLLDEEHDMELVKEEIFTCKRFATILRLAPYSSYLIKLTKAQ